MVLVDPTTQGATRAQVVLAGAMATSASDASSFKGAVGRGSAKVTEATKMSGPTHTLLVFDQSGSFRKHWDRAFDEASTFASALGSDHTVEVATFGTGYEKHGKATDSAGLKALLDQARTNGPRDKTTRMHSLVKEGINQVATGLPPTQGGLRQVIVFSDLDEEGTFTAQMAIDAARAQGVRVNIVFFASESAAHTDNAQRLAESTGGLLVDATGGSVSTKLEQLATAPSRTWWLKLGFCDVPKGQGTFQDELKVEVWGQGSRQGASLPFPFRHAADATSTEPCVAATPAPEPVPADTGFPWWWLLVAALLLGGFLLLLSLPFVIAALTRSSRKEEPPPPPPPAADPGDHVEGTVAPEVFKPVAAGLLDRLPPTHLERVKGPAHLPARLPITRKEMTLGAAGHNDLVLDGDTVSGEHASLELFAGGDLWVRDRDATNGTWVDGQRLAKGERRLLRPGTELGFGQHLVYRVVQDSVGPSRSDGPPPPPEAPPEPEPKRQARKTTFRPVKG